MVQETTLKIFSCGAAETRKAKEEKKKKHGQQQKQPPSQSWSQLRVVGLMTLPAAETDPAANRPTFARLRELRDTLRHEPGGEHLCELSMGMSGDFEVAIEEGATIVRVGTAIFGPRSER